MSDVFRKQYRELSSLEEDTLAMIKDRAESLHDSLEVLGQGREISLAKTKLEECVMWAVKHLTK